ncbi:SGNH hydrolase-type esterase domain-containing protein [Tanacetum coccineum]
MVAGTSSEGDKERLSLMAEVDIKGNSELSLSVNAVLSNYDLLIEILLRLPVLSLLLFKSVSKHWFRIIRTPDFIFRHRSENPNLNAPFGLLIRRINTKPNSIEYDLESFDNRIPSKRSIVFTLGSEAPHGRVEILQSCNGLLLCCVYPCKFYVYNPTSELFKRLPTKSHTSSVRLAFDPTKSPHYKVVQPVRLQNDDEDYRLNSTIQVHTYSSETGAWSVCGDQFSETCFEGFKEGVFWNDAFHWLNMNNVFRKKTLHFELDIGNEQPVLTELKLPVTFDGKSHFQSKLFESRGCLLLLGKDHAHSRQLNVFEMRDDDSEWSVKFIVNLDDIMMPLPRTWMIRPCVWSIVLGEREEDSFMIIDLLSKVVQYNPVLKTVRTLADLESIGSPLMVSNFDGFQCIASLAEV